jgi:hypothetical protein
VRLATNVWPVAATFVLGVLGLCLPGTPGDVAAFVWLGVFPGLALAHLLLPGATPATRWTLGVALAPLATAVTGWALVRAGLPLQTAARLVAVGGWLLFAGGEARSLAARDRGADDAPGDRVAWGWALAAAAFVVLPALVNAWTRVRSDSWVHAGIVWEIAERGLPPQDPRFAGAPLHYLWFYNLFLALLHTLRPASSPFTHMVTANACWIGLEVWLGWQLAWALWRERAAARAALPLLLTGLNAGALVLWPLWLLRGLSGEVRGLAEVRRILSETHLGSVDVMYQLGAPFAWMVNSWDKFMLGTALGYAYLLLLLSLWAGARWLGDAREARVPGAPPPWRWLLVAFAASAGMMLFHTVVGLSVIPVSVVACLLLAGFAGRDSRLGPRARPLWLAAASLAGLAVTWPYFHSIASGWDAGLSGAERRHLHFDWHMPWTLATACGLVACAAWPAVRRVIAERHRAGVWLACWMLGMTAIALLVHLPGNNEFKFVWQVFAPLAILGGAGLPAMLAAWRVRLGRPLATACIAFAFVLPAALLQFGFLLDPSGATAPETHREPGEPELYAWVREHTPVNAVFADFHARDVLLVEGRRRLLVGIADGPDRVAPPPPPREAMARRRAVAADLYGPARDLAGDATCLDSLGGPAYVLYRARDFADSTPWRALDADTARFERVYAAGGCFVYRRRP